MGKEFTIVQVHDLGYYPSAYIQKPGALTTHQVEIMKEHHVFYEPGYNGTVTGTTIWANDFGPAVVNEWWEFQP